MTLNIEEMKRDREMGTPGPWVGDADGEVCMDDDVMAWVCCINFDNVADEQALSDQRRIVRVPDMEARILSDADRIAQLERERDEAQSDRNRLASAGAKLSQAVEEFEFFSDYRTSHDPDGEKWVYMHASHWEALLSDASDARSAWSAAGQPEADDEALRERVAKALCRSSPNHKMYHYPGDAPRKWRTFGGALWDTQELAPHSAERIMDMADAAIRAMRGRT